MFSDQLCCYNCLTNLLIHLSAENDSIFWVVIQLMREFNLVVS